MRSLLKFSLELRNCSGLETLMFIIHSFIYSFTQLWSQTAWASNSNMTLDELFKNSKVISLSLKEIK